MSGFLSAGIAGGGDIPDSVVSQYDAQAEASTGVITSLTDREGGNDLSGSCSVISSGINNYQTYRFDGSDDEMAGSMGILAEPFAVVAVIQYQGPEGANNAYFDAYDSRDKSNDRIFEIIEDNDYRPGRGNNSGSTVSGAQTTPSIIVLEGHDTDQVTLRENGTQLTSQTLSAGSIPNFVLANLGRDGNELEVDYGEVLLMESYDTVSGTQIQNAELYLSNKWDIAL